MNISRYIMLDQGLLRTRLPYQKHIVIGLSIAIILHLLGIGVYWGINYYLSRPDDQVRTVRILKYSELGPPPSIKAATPPIPAISISAPVAKPSIGVPVPVPDALVLPEKTIATQEEMKEIEDIPVSTTGKEGVVAVEKDLDVKVEGPPPEFVPYEKGPEIVKKVEPTYPDMARKAGVQGKVILKLWLGKDGKIKEVQVIRSDNELLTKAAIVAVNQWVFTPAIMNKEPVEVWLSVPVIFRLQQ